MIDPPTAESDSPPRPAPPRRRAWNLLVRLAAAGSAVLIAAGMIGQLVRDPHAIAALLMYIPLPLIGASALLLDLICRGRSIPWPRFGLSAMGMVAIAWSSATMIGIGTADERRSGDREVSILHENVQWGGGLFRGPQTWSAQRAAILEKKPDLIVLSEAPPEDWIGRLVAEIGPGASSVDIRNEPASPYLYHLVVVSRWPLRKEEHSTFPGGAGMSVVADVDGRRLRLLVVDGISKPTRSRLPFLDAVATACREAQAAGRPIDLVLGDFNTPARSLGFDRLAAIGYRLAGRSARGWRGSFPAWLPIYDIDHVWIRDGLRLDSCAFFNGPHTDHRGQVVRILFPEVSRE